MQAFVLQMFVVLSQLSSPLKGYRTAIGFAFAVLGILYGLIALEPGTFTASLGLLFSIIGIKPDPAAPAPSPSAVALYTDSSKAA